MLLEVISAEYVQAYQIALVFNTGDTVTVDLEATIFSDPRPIFRPLQQRSYFKTFTVCWNTIGWDNQADFAPEFLYELAKQQEFGRGKAIVDTGLAWEQGRPTLRAEKQNVADLGCVEAVIPGFSGERRTELTPGPDWLKNQPGGR